MKAIILAAGMGKRLGRYTRNATKCMVQVNGVSLIDHALSALQESGITHIVIVVGYMGDALIAHIGKKYPRLTIEFIWNEKYNTTNNIYSLWLARQALEDDDILLLESDLIFEPEILKELINCEHPNVAALSAFESWMDGTVTLLDTEDKIVSIIEKSRFRWNDVDSYYKTVNIYKFSQAFSTRYYIPFLEAYQKAFGYNAYYEQVLQVLSFFPSIQVHGYKIAENRWYEIDDANDLAIAEAQFAEAPQRFGKIHARYGGFWRFPSMLDYCYLVNPYFPKNQMYEEIAANLRTLASQYPSGAEVQSQLAGKVFGVEAHHIAVGNGAAELIDKLFDILPGKVACLVPSFNEYFARIGEERFVPLHSPDTGISHNIATYAQGLENADSLVVINPHNPGGGFINKSELIELLEAAKARGKTLIVDESFIDFCESTLRYTFIDEAMLESYKNLVVIKSISKSYGVAGFRLGVLASGNEELIARLKKGIAIWNINSLAEFFLQIFDKYKADYWASCDKIASERAILANALDASGCFEVLPSQANFITCKIKDTVALSAKSLGESLLQSSNILIKSLTGNKFMPRGEYIRFAIRNSQSNAYLVNCLEKVIHATRH